MSPSTANRASHVEDFDEISQVMKTLLEGEACGDVAKLKLAFHPDARMLGQAEGQRYEMPISEYIAFAAAAPASSEGNYQARVRSVQQTADVAVAVAIAVAVASPASTSPFSAARPSPRWRWMRRAPPCSHPAAC